MKNITPYLLPIAFLTIGILCCNKKAATENTKPQPLKVNLYVRYLEETKSVYAEALFATDSTSIKMEQPVKCQERFMRETQVPRVGWRYQIEIPRQAESPDTLWFEFSNPQNETIKYPVLLPRLYQVYTPGNGINKKAGGSVCWHGNALSDAESMVIRLVDTTGTNYTINHIGKTLGTKIDLLPVQLQATAVGNARLALTRKNTVVDKSNSKLLMLYTTEYYTKEMPTIIGE